MLARGVIGAFGDEIQAHAVCVTRSRVAQLPERTVRTRVPQVASSARERLPRHLSVAIERAQGRARGSDARRPTAGAADAASGSTAVAAAAGRAARPRGRSRRIAGGAAAAAAGERAALDARDHLATAQNRCEREEGARRGCCHQWASAETCARPGARRGWMRQAGAGVGGGGWAPDDVIRWYAATVWCAAAG